MSKLKQRIEPSQARIEPSQARIEPPQARIEPSQASIEPSQASLKNLIKKIKYTLWNGISIIENILKYLF